MAQRVLHMAEAADEAKSKRLALQPILDVPQREALVGLQNPQAVLSAIATQTRMRINIINNTDTEMPILVGALSFGEKLLVEEKQKLLQLHDGLAIPLARRFEAALAKFAQDETRRGLLIDLMQEIVTDKHNMMKQFVGERIFGIDAQLEAVEWELRQKFQRWDQRMTALEIV